MVKETRITCNTCGKDLTITDKSGTSMIEVKSIYLPLSYDYQIPGNIPQPIFDIEGEHYCNLKCLSIEIDFLNSKA